MSRFLLGVNYWPRSTAMYAWQRFDLGQMREDFVRMRALGFDVVRFFLTWEAFQPHRDTIDAQALRRFDSVLQAIGDAGLLAMPTLFCGHMSGVNWLPAWTLDSTTPHGRFRTIANGASSPYGIGDFYADSDLLAAQVRLARSLGKRAAGHPALFAWDLGNEFSNLREPRNELDAAAWSTLLTEALLEESGAGTTAGIHGEDLERDRKIRPSSIAAPLRFATMHGYPVYSLFSRGRLDESVVPFLCALVQSFGKKPVLFSEFGNPECPPRARDSGGIACVNEEEMATYATAVLERLVRQGAIGALWWCWTDYDLALADLPPFDRAPHELRFGIIRADGSEKPVARALARFARKGRPVREAPKPLIGEQEYYASMPQGVFDAYRDYCRAYP